MNKENLLKELRELRSKYLAQKIDATEWRIKRYDIVSKIGGLENATQNS